MGKAIRWGIIGSGGWADHTFAPAIVAANGSKLCAVLGPTMKDSESFCSRHNINLAYSDLSKFVSDESIDAIWVAGPNHMHKAFSIAALESGKHVLCENQWPYL